MTTTMTNDELRDALKKQGKAVYGNKEMLYERLNAKANSISKGIDKRKRASNDDTTNLNVVEMQSKLPDNMAKVLNLTYLKMEGGKYIYTKLAKKAAGTKVAGTKAAGTKVAGTKVPFAKDKCKGGTCPIAKKKKKLTEKPKECDTVTDEALDEACSVAAWRIENHMSLDLMKKVAECFGIESFPRNKKDAAEIVAEQLCYETDSDSGSDDESDSDGD